MEVSLNMCLRKFQGLNEEIIYFFSYSSKILVRTENRYTLFSQCFTGSTLRQLCCNFEFFRAGGLPTFQHKAEKTKSHFSTQRLPAPMGLSGLVRSEGARRETDSRVKDIKRKVRGREIGFHFLFPLWAMGRAV